jgi:hypothetical protein
LLRCGKACQRLVDSAWFKTARLETIVLGARLALYSAAMSEQADLDELARRYLDLWQDQMTALAGDPDFAEALQQLMTAMSIPGGAPGPAVPEFWRAWPAMMTGQQPGQQTEVSADDGTGGVAPGSPAAATAPDGGGPDLDFLTRRLATLEDRIAALEAGAKRGRRGTAGKSRKPPS